MWVYLTIYFHPTVPLPHTVSLRSLEPTTPSTSCMCPSAIILHEIDQATHGKKISQYFHVWATNQKTRWMKNTTDKVNNNFKLLFNVDGVFREYFLS